MKSALVVRFRALVIVSIALRLLLSAVRAQQSDEKAKDEKDKPFKGMQWRLIGPFRGGRVLAVTGVSGEPNTYYFGAVSGGVWKTTNSGSTWEPLFDKQQISSVGAI